MVAAEASDAMGMGDFPRAWHFYSRLLKIDNRGTCQACHNK